MIVDSEDFEWLNQWKWQLHGGKWGEYALRQKMEDGKSKPFYMHREILKHYNYKIKNLFVDHINHNGLDNRKANLRLVNDSQNQMNRIMAQNNNSGYKGITSYRNGKWRASTQLNQKHIHLGYFNTKEEAALAYNQFARENFGEFAYLNKIGGNRGSLYA